LICPPEGGGDVWAIHIHRLGQLTRRNTTRCRGRQRNGPVILRGRTPQ
jgi:hypothetical protein